MVLTSQNFFKGLNQIWCYLIEAKLEMNIHTYLFLSIFEGGGGRGLVKLICYKRNVWTKLQISFKPHASQLVEKFSYHHFVSPFFPCSHPSLTKVVYEPKECVRLFFLWFVWFSTKKNCWLVKFYFCLFWWYFALHVIPPWSSSLPLSLSLTAFNSNGRKCMGIT